MKKDAILTGAVGIFLMFSSSISMSIYYGLRDISIYTMDPIFSIPLIIGYVLIAISIIVYFFGNFTKK